MSVVSEVLHACLGFSALGQCAYDPGKPTVYFSIGEAVAALGFTFAVAQIARPIYQFRLRARSIRLGWLYATVFLGVALVIVAAILPSASGGNGGPLSYPLVWEIAAALMFAMAYGVFLLAAMNPVSVNGRNIVRFVRVSGNFLAETGHDSRDQLDFVRDLCPSVPMLVHLAAFEEARQETSAFYDFIHRRELERAAFARSLLMLLGDPALCETMVTKAPWATAAMLGDLSEARLHARSAEPFVRELGRQAILAEESMVAREDGYYGFASAPLLSDSLFGSYFILNAYNPLDAFGVMSGAKGTPALLTRFNSAARRMFETLISNGALWHERAAISVEQYIESVSMNIWVSRANGSLDKEYALALLESIDNAVDMADALLKKVDARTFNALYRDPTNDRGYTVIECLAEIVCNILLFISNDFKGGDDELWGVANEAISKLFPTYGKNIKGMTPFQQRVAMKLINKLQENMKGFYPSISRVLIACVGPYKRLVKVESGSAFDILRRAMYRELKNLPNLVKEGKLNDFLPDHATFDPATSVLRYTYRDGTFRDTNLAKIRIGPVSLLAADVCPNRD